MFRLAGATWCIFWRPDRGNLQRRSGHRCGSLAGTTDNLSRGYTRKLQRGLPPQSMLPPIIFTKVSHPTGPQQLFLQNTRRRLGFCRRKTRFQAFQTPPPLFFTNAKSFNQIPLLPTGPEQLWGEPRDVPENHVFSSFPDPALFFTNAKGLSPILLLPNGPQQLYL